MGKAQQEKESAHYQKQVEVAQKQLEATIEMKNALISYSNEIINTVSQMATFKNIAQAQRPFDYAKDRIKQIPMSKNKKIEVKEDCKFYL
jgi:predicted ATP-binding protein involved in virulence